jgi:hypothetical protein
MNACGMEAVGTELEQIVAHPPAGRPGRRVVSEFSYDRADFEIMRE